MPGHQACHEGAQEPDAIRQASSVGRGGFGSLGWSLDGGGRVAVFGDEGGPLAVERRVVRVRHGVSLWPFVKPECRKAPHPPQ